MLKRPIIIIQIIVLVALIFVKYFAYNTTQDLLFRHPVFHALISFLIYYLVIKTTSFIILAYYSRRNKIPLSQKNNVHFGIENIANILLAFGFIGLVLRVMGINPLEIVTSATIVAAAIAIVTRDYIADFLSGIYLSFSNTFEIADYVKLDKHKGRIVEIGMLKIKILNDDDDVVILPNFKIYQSDIINYTKRDVRLLSLDFELALAHVVSIQDLEKDLVITLKDFSQYIEPKSYKLKVEEVKADYIGLKFQYKLLKIDSLLQREIRKKTTREVFNYISERVQQKNELLPKQ